MNTIDELYARVEMINAKAPTELSIEELETYIEYERFERARKQRGIKLAKPKPANDGALEMLREALVPKPEAPKQKLDRRI